MLHTGLAAFIHGVEGLMCASKKKTDKPLVISVCTKKIMFFSTKRYVVGTQKNRLNETVLLSTENIC